MSGKGFAASAYECLYDAGLAVLKGIFVPSELSDSCLGNTASSRRLLPLCLLCLLCLSQAEHLDGVVPCRLTNFSRRDPFDFSDDMGDMDNSG